MKAYIIIKKGKKPNIKDVYAIGEKKYIHLDKDEKWYEVELTIKGLKK